MTDSDCGPPVLCQLRNNDSSTREGTTVSFQCDERLLPCASEVTAVCVHGGWEVLSSSFTSKYSITITMDTLILSVIAINFDLSQSLQQQWTYHLH